MFLKYVGLNLVAVGIFLLDRSLKLFFQENPTVIFGGDFFSGILSFHFETNTGIAFGLPLNQVLLLFLIFITVVFLTSIIVQEYKKKNLITIFALSLVLIGALSNLMDRLKFGYVIDYIDLKWFTVFNLADAAITVGVVVFALIMFFDKKVDKMEELR